MASRRKPDLIYVMSLQGAWSKIGVTHDASHRRMHLHSAGVGWPIEIASVWKVGRSAMSIESALCRRFIDRRAKGREYFVVPDAELIDAVEAEIAARRIRAEKVSVDRHVPYMRAFIQLRAASDKLDMQSK